MPRKRYLKPGFFQNEDLAELSFEYRLVFQGLWLWADREGRLEDRPKRLKGNIMPYDNVDFDKALEALAESGFIQRYNTTVNGGPFKAIQIINFKKHQDVHTKEQASTIPAPVLQGASTVQAPVQTDTSPSLNLELVTRDLNLEPELVIDDDVNAQVRKIEIEEAISDYDQVSNASFDPSKAHLSSEKEKICEKKEKVLPTLDEAIQGVCETAYWRNVVEHHKQTDVDRQALFKIFYEQKEDNYKILLPSWVKIAEHFYYWIPIHLRKDTLKKINSNATRKSTTRGAVNGNTAGQSVPSGTGFGKL